MESMNTHLEHKITKVIPDNYTKAKETGVESLMTKECFGEPTIVMCIDEGCNPHSANHTKDAYTLNLAGTGILLGIEKTVELFRNNEDLQKSIKTLTWHEGCGAAALAKQSNPDITAEGFVLELAKRLKEELGMDCEVLKIKGEKEAEEEAALTRPFEYHNAMSVYVNGTTKAFDYVKNNTLPAGFTLDSGYFGKEVAEKELAVVLSIAFGGHGMNELITKENPFMINYITDETTGDVPPWITGIVSNSSIDPAKIKIILVKNDTN